MKRIFVFTSLFFLIFLIGCNKKVEPEKTAQPEKCENFIIDNVVVKRCEENSPAESPKKDQKRDNVASMVSSENPNDNGSVNVSEEPREGKGIDGKLKEDTDLEPELGKIIPPKKNDPESELEKITPPKNNGNLSKDQQHATDNAKKAQGELQRETKTREGNKDPESELGNITSPKNGNLSKDQQRAEDNANEAQNELEHEVNQLRGTKNPPKKPKKAEDNGKYSGTKQEADKAFEDMGKEVK